MLWQYISVAHGGESRKSIIDIVLDSIWHVVYLAYKSDIVSIGDPNGNYGYNNAESKTKQQITCNGIYYNLKCHTRSSGNLSNKTAHKKQEEEKLKDF